MSPTFLLGTTSAERLLEFNLITGAQIANSSVTGLAEITGLRGSLGTAIVRGVDGNYSTVTLSTGAATEFSYSAPTGDDLVSAEFVQGSASTAILLYRGTNGSLLVLYDLATTHVTGTLALGQDVAEAEGIAGASSVYAFVRTTQGVEGWAESAGTFTPFTNLTETGVADYSLVQYGSGILVGLSEHHRQLFGPRRYLGPGGDRRFDPAATERWGDPVELRQLSDQRLDLRALPRDHGGGRRAPPGSRRGPHPPAPSKGRVPLRISLRDSPIP